MTDVLPGCLHTIHVAVLTAVEKVIGDAEFPAADDGYQRAITFLTSASVPDRVGVEAAASMALTSPAPWQQAGSRWLKSSGQLGLRGAERGRSDQLALD